MKFISAVKSILFIQKIFPINEHNYLQFIRQNYGSFACDSVFHYGKTQLKIAKVRLDLKFLKTCHREQLTPTFVRFRVPVSHQQYKSSFSKCQLDIIKLEIRSNKKKLSRLYRHTKRIKDYVTNNIDCMARARIFSIIERLLARNIDQWSKIHEEKLTKLRQHRHQQLSLNQPSQTYNYPKNPVRNYSKRTLTVDELDVLANGLDFVYCTNKLDDSTFITNMENFFLCLLGQVTDKRNYERIDENDKIEYKLTSEQLLTANQIRQLANNFRRNALKKIKRHSTLNKNQIETLKYLAKDKSIFITKADKGRCTVVLDRTQYIDSMESLINECTSFKLVDVDPTVSQEDKLVKKLRELKACNFISEQEYHLCYPTGSQPARMYGLPKVHKERLSFRPILAATGTFNYKLAQLLVKRLSHLRKSETIIANTFSFVDELHSMDFNMQ